MTKRRWLVSRLFKVQIAAILLSYLLTNAISYGQSTQPCVLGYQIGFFNGVWNTAAQADSTLDSIADAVSEATQHTDPSSPDWDTYNHEDIVYELFYNQTGGQWSPLDLAETFIQRAQQLDPTGTLGNDYLYLFWESINGESSFQSIIVSAVGATISTFFTDFSNYLIAQAVAALSAAFSNPPTATDYATHDSQLASDAAENRKLLLFSHSQGDLFLGQAYSYILPVAGAGRLETVHIAPASPPPLAGPPLYLLSMNDLIINGLRTVGGYAGVVANNTTIPSGADFTGHRLVETYLDPSRNGRMATEALLTTALGNFDQPMCNITLSPISSTLTSGASTSLTVSINPAPTDPNLSTTYSWSIGGNGGGTILTSNGPETSQTTSSPTITYVAGTNNSGGQDTVSVIAYVGPVPENITDAKQVGTASARVDNSGGVVTISPTAATVPEFGTQQFTATVSGGGSVDWSLTEGSVAGSVATSGLFSAGNTPGIYHLVATNHIASTESATAVVTVSPSTEIRFSQSTSPINNYRGTMFTLSWSTPFTDTHYTAVCTTGMSGMSAFTTITAPTPEIVSKSATGITATVFTDSGANLSVTLSCIAVSNSYQGPLHWSHGSYPPSTQGPPLPVTLNWNIAFSDSSYRAVCTVIGNDGTQNEDVYDFIQNKTPSGLSVGINNAPAGGLGGSIDCIGAEASNGSVSTGSVKISTDYTDFPNGEETGTLTWDVSLPTSAYIAVCGVGADPQSKTTQLLPVITSYSNAALGLALRNDGTNGGAAPVDCLAFPN